MTLAALPPRLVSQVGRSELLKFLQNIAGQWCVEIVCHDNQANGRAAATATCRRHSCHRFSRPGSDDLLALFRPAEQIGEMDLGLLDTQYSVHRAYL